MATMRARRVYGDSTLTLVTIESIDVGRVRTTNLCQVYGKSEPVAVVVSGPDGQYALDVEGKPVDLDRLRQDVAGLDAVIPVVDRR